MSKTDRDIINNEIERQLKRGYETADNYLLMKADLLIDKAYRHLTIAEALQKFLEYEDQEELVEKYREALKMVIMKCELAMANPTQNNRIINEILVDVRGITNG